MCHTGNSNNNKTMITIELDSTDGRFFLKAGGLIFVIIRMTFKLSGCPHPLDTKESRAGGRKAVWEDGESAKRCLRLDCRRVTVFSSLHRDDGANLRTRAGQSH